MGTITGTITGAWIMVPIMVPGVSIVAPLVGIREFLVKWFRGPLGVGEAREVFYSAGDLESR